MNTGNTPVNQNIVYNFSTNTQEIANKQDLAVMPARLAIRLLQLLSLTQTSFYTIQSDYIKLLRSASTEEDLVNMSLDFINERELIANVKAEKWNAYQVKEEVTETALTDAKPVQVVKSHPEEDETHQNHQEYKADSNDRDAAH